jgi:hypothetical protein
METENFMQSVSIKKKTSVEKTTNLLFVCGN